MSKRNKQDDSSIYAKEAHSIQYCSFDPLDPKSSQIPVQHKKRELKPGLDAVPGTVNGQDPPCGVSMADSRILRSSERDIEHPQIAIPNATVVGNDNEVSLLQLIFSQKLGLTLLLLLIIVPSIISTILAVWIVKAQSSPSIEVQGVASFAPAPAPVVEAPQTLTSQTSLEEDQCVNQPSSSSILVATNIPTSSILTLSSVSPSLVSIYKSGK